MIFYINSNVDILYNLSLNVYKNDLDFQLVYHVRF